MSEARDPHFIEDNRRQIERLSQLGWYHSIELPDGHVIEGHQSIEQLRRRIQQFPIPEDLTGRRVLDIGAWDGWFSFEMERRGAEVLAVDSTRNTRLLEARRLLGSRIDYRIADICRLTHKQVGTFDIVLFLGVLYHLKHPLLALENVCAMTRGMACIESFVSDADPAALPLMEFYETTELRGQLDNWVGPNLSCLMAFTRTAGFARVNFESVLAERAHVTAYRDWLPSDTPADRRIICVDNAATHTHSFDPDADDYITFYFTSGDSGLTCDNVHPRIGPFGSRPIHVADTGGGWQATCKIPPGLNPGWYDAGLGGPTVRIGIADPPRRPNHPDPAIEIVRVTDGKTFEDNRARVGPEGGHDAGLGIADPPLPLHHSDPAIEIVRVTDGKTFEDKRVRVGPESCISAWVTGVPGCLRLNGTDLPAIWIAPSDGDNPRQVNALLPAGLEPGRAFVCAVSNGRESATAEIELYRP